MPDTPGSRAYLEAFLIRKGCREKMIDGYRDDDECLFSEEA